MSHKESMPISEFKATCLAVLKRVKRTGRPVVITRFDEPIAEVIPVAREARGASWLGVLAGHGRIVGDVVSPIVPAEEWEAGPE